MNSLALYQMFNSEIITLETKDKKNILCLEATADNQKEGRLRENCLLIMSNWERKVYYNSYSHPNMEST